MTKIQEQTGLGSRIIASSLLILLLMSNLLAQTPQVKNRSVREIPLSGVKDRPFFFKPLTMQLAPAGLLILESGESCLKLLGTDGKLKLTIGKSGQGPGEFDAPKGVDFYENKIYATDQFNRQIKVFNLEGKLLNSFRVDILPVYVAVIDPDRIVVSSRPTPISDRQSILYCYDSKGKLRWQCLSAVPSDNTTILTLANEILLRKDSRGNIFVIYKHNNAQILKINSDGKLTEKIKLDESYQLKQVNLPIKIRKNRVSMVCWNFDYCGDRFYLIVPEKDGYGDFAPGKDVLVFDISGRILEKINFPQAIRLLTTDGSTFYVLNSEDELFAYRMAQE